jgi:hypothetical protein
LSYCCEYSLKSVIEGSDSTYTALEFPSYYSDVTTELNVESDGIEKAQSMKPCGILCISQIQRDVMSQTKFHVAFGLIRSTCLFIFMIGDYSKLFQFSGTDA